jgi:hypothetical protein
LLTYIIYNFNILRLVVLMVMYGRGAVRALAVPPYLLFLGVPGNKPGIGSDLVGV